MSQNTNPIFPLIPVNTWVSGAAANAATPGVTANTTKDLTSGTIYGPIETAELPDIILPLNISLAPSYRIYATFGTAVAAGFHLTAIGGDY